jgi:alpha-galactosidase
MFSAFYVHSKGLKFGIHIMRGIPREAVKKNLESVEKI